MDDNKYAGKKCFVIMPYGVKNVKGSGKVNFDKIYEKMISPAVEELGIECERCDEIIGGGAITKKMFRGIFDADVSVVDITSLNPNVFYELGIRHALHKNLTLVICKKGKVDIPFNIRGLYILMYETNTETQLKNSKERICQYIQNGLDRPSTDSIVHDYLNDLKVERKPKIIQEREEKLYLILDAPGKEIGYITGNIKNIDSIDIWVNSENTDMEMARYYENSVSANIRYLGARKDITGYVVDDLIAKDLRKITRGRGCVAGNIVVTTAGELEHTNNVKRIFHAAAVYAEPGQGYKPINNIAGCVRCALVKADSVEMKGVQMHSILFPLMGTGTSRADAQETANKLIDEALEYARQNPKSRINKIYFLAFNEQDREICKHKFVNDPRIATPTRASRRK